MKYYALFFPGAGIVGVTTDINPENSFDYHIEITKEEFDSFDDWSEDKVMKLELIKRPLLQMEKEYVLRPSKIKF